MKIGDTIRGDIETFKIVAITDDTQNAIVTYEDESGQRWQTRSYNIGADDKGFVIGEEAYDMAVN